MIFVNSEMQFFLQTSASVNVPKRPNRRSGSWDESKIGGSKQWQVRGKVGQKAYLVAKMYPAWLSRRVCTGLLPVLETKVA